MTPQPYPWELDPPHLRAFRKAIAEWKQARAAWKQARAARNKVYTAWDQDDAVWSQACAVLEKARVAFVKSEDVLKQALKGHDPELMRLFRAECADVSWGKDGLVFQEVQP